MAIKKNEKITETASEKSVKPEVLAKEETPKKVRVSKRRQKLPADMLVECQNMTMGKLIYKSTRQNGYMIVWSNPGDIEEIELSELVSMRNSQIRFFTQNWIGIDDPEVVEYLGIGKYYEGVPAFEDYESIFFQPIDDMKVTIANLPKGAKKTLGIKAAEMINDGTIDSMKTVKYLCEAFDLMIDE